MGIGGISIWQLLIILVIVVLLFGTKRLRGIGDDLGSAIRGFRASLKGSEPEEPQDANFEQPQAIAQPVTPPQQHAAAPVQSTPVAQTAAQQPAVVADNKPTTQDKI